MPVEKFCSLRWTESLLLSKRDPAGTSFDKSSHGRPQTELLRVLGNMKQKLSIADAQFPNSALIFSSLFSSYSISEIAQ